MQGCWKTPHPEPRTAGTLPAQRMPTSTWMVALSWAGLHQSNPWLIAFVVLSRSESCRYTQRRCRVARLTHEALPMHYHMQVYNVKYGFRKTGAMATPRRRSSASAVLCCAVRCEVRVTISRRGCETEYNRSHVHTSIRSTGPGARSGRGSTLRSFYPKRRVLTARTSTAVNTTRRRMCCAGSRCVQRALDKK